MVPIPSSPRGWDHSPLSEAYSPLDTPRLFQVEVTSDALEEWHRHNLPTFTERMKSRLRNHCEDGHQPWPAKGRHTRYTAEISRRTREEHYAGDVGSMRPNEATGRWRPRLGLVDLDTGEINDL